MSLTPLSCQNAFAMIHKSRVPEAARRGQLFESAMARLVAWWREFFAVLPYGHPVRAVALAALGKLLAVDEPGPPPKGQEGGGLQRFPPSGPARLKMAYQTMARARGELLIAFGRENEGGRVGKEVREAMVRVEKELEVWNVGVRNALEDAQASTRSPK